MELSTLTALLADASLKAYYKLENVNDETANAFNLTNNNTVTFTAAKFNNGANFGSANTNKYLSTTNTLGIDGGPISMGGWGIVLAEPTSSARYIFAEQANSNTDTGYRLEYMDDAGTRKLKAIRYQSGAVVDEAVYAVNLGTAAFHHMYLTYDGVTLRLWLDKVNVASVAASGNAGTAAQSGFTLGTRLSAGGQFASMTLDDFAVFSRALTHGEIQYMYEATTPTLPMFDNVADFGSPSSAASYSKDLQIGNVGGNRMGFVAFQLEDVTKTVTSVTIGGVACTQGHTFTNDGGYERVEIWYLPGPAVGLKTCVVNLSGASVFRGFASSYLNMAQSSPIDATGGDSTDAVNTETLDVTVVTADSLLVAFGGFNAGGTASAGMGAVARAVNGPKIWIDSGTTVAAGARSMQYNETDTNQTVGVILAIKPVVLTSVKKFMGINQASVKKFMGITNASTKKIMGISNV